MVSQRMHIVLALATALVLAISALAAPSTSRDRGDRALPQNSNSGNALTQDSAQASARLMRELMETYKCDSYKKGVFQVELRDDNLYEWDIKLPFRDPEQALHEDLRLLKFQDERDFVLLRITFPQNYPNEMPFVRIVYPIMLGRSGAFCMYLLSPQGYIPDCTVEALILTIIDYMIEFKYRVDSKYKSEYKDENSEQDRVYYAQTHGWDKPRPNDHVWYKGPDDE